VLPESDGRSARSCRREAEALSTRSAPTRPLATKVFPAAATVVQISTSTPSVRVPVIIRGRWIDEAKSLIDGRPCRLTVDQ
jgi:hypothetical protein